MNRRDYIKMAGMSAFAFVLRRDAGAAENAENRSAIDRKPNIILILTDDQGYGDLSLTGNPVLKTPNMDRLGSEGVHFANFHVDSYCSPTRSALMTGRYSHRVGVWGTICGRNMLRDDETTMADVLRYNGYRTGLFGKWHLGSNYPYRPMDRGFDEWLGHGDGGTGCTTDYWGNDRVNDHYIHNGKWEGEFRKGFEADVFFDAAKQFVRDNVNKPFFIYLPLYNPHAPCSIADGKWADPYRGKVSDRVADFYASIARVDDNIGRLMELLKTEKIGRDTLIIFMSDNGTGSGEKVFNAGMRGKKGSHYDGGHRVPCFMYWPAGGFDKPVKVDKLTAHLDLLPTLVDLCSLKLPKPIAFDGTSLKPLLTNSKVAWPDRTIVLGTVQNITPAPKYGNNCSVMTDRWRLVEDKELYDMAADPGQETNVAEKYPEIVAKLRTEYKKYWNSVSANDRGWRGRPVIGTSLEEPVELCAEDWLPVPVHAASPWSQGSILAGRANFGCWPVVIATSGTYNIKLRRWPGKVDAPLTGLPANRKVVDAWLDGDPVTSLLYASSSKRLSIVKAQLKIGALSQTVDVAPDDRTAVFTVKLEAGPVDLETAFFDEQGKALCSAYYAEVSKE